MGHYYDSLGNACHTVIGKNGKERPTKITDARKNGWYPSVTKILGIMHNLNLERYKIKQAIYAALTLPRKPDENDDDFYDRVIQDSQKEVEDAADLGTRIHKAIELHCSGQPYDCTLEPYIAPVKKWIADNNVEFLQSELRLVNHSEGYAGTTDAIIRKDGELYIFDAKSRKTRPEYKITPWDKEPTQIAAYAQIANVKRGVNLYISTTEPGRMGEAWYDEETVASEYEKFILICKLWQKINKYTPPNAPHDRSSGKDAR